MISTLEGQQLRIEMCATLDILPGELLDSVLERLATSDVVNLWKTSKTLSHRMNGYLFSHPGSQSHVLR